MSQKHKPRRTQLKDGSYDFVKELRDKKLIDEKGLIAGSDIYVPKVENLLREKLVLRQLNGLKLKGKKTIPDPQFKRGEYFKAMGKGDEVFCFIESVHRHTVIRLFSIFRQTGSDT